MKTNKYQFNTEVIPVNDTRFAIKVKSINYSASINTLIIVDKKTLQVCEDFECNHFISAIDFLNDLRNEINIKLKFDRINRFGIFY